MLPKYSDLKEMFKKGLTAEDQVKILSMNEQNLELREENLALKNENIELKRELELKKKIEYRKPSYWSINEGGDDGPFCQRCYDVDNALIRLQGGGNDFWKCEQCKSNYRGENYKKPKKKRATVAIGRRGGI